MISVTVQMFIDLDVLFFLLLLFQIVQHCHYHLLFVTSIELC